MNYSVADVIASMGGDAISGRTADISAILPYGIAPGAKAVMRKEKKAAEEAISTGIYVTWRSIKTGQDCARVGSMSRCFCGCTYGMHAFRKGSILPVCTTCECQSFNFVPSRPEEIGEWWLPRRPGFDASSWRAKCRCGHTHEAHHPTRRSCESCKCREFYSAYGCVVCEAHQEDHQTQVETAQERTDAGRPVGRDYIPLSQSPHLSQLTFGRKPSKSSAELPSSKPTAVGTAVEEGGDASGSASVKKSETELPPLTLQILPMAPRETRRISSDSTNGVSVVGGAARASIDSRGACSETPSATSSRRRHTATMSSSHKGKSQQQQQQQSLKIRPTMSNRGAAGRVRFAGDSTKDDYNSSGGGSIMSPSPELLYASGRITPARYHEMLAELDGRGGGGGGDAAGGAGGGGISSLCGAAPASTRKAAVPSQPNVGGARRRTEPAAIERR